MDLSALLPLPTEQTTLPSFGFDFAFGYHPYLLVALRVLRCAPDG